MPGSPRAARAQHLLGWLALILLTFLQPPGQIAADTKFDLTADPGKFLRGALHAWTDEFPLGQMQNQAYGYLFPQGPFFLLFDACNTPSWITQRLWWSLLLCIAYSGTLTLARRLEINGWPAVTAALLYALSPRILTTLTAISSEAWPVALVPWTLVPLVPRAPGAPHAASDRPNIAAAILPVALMGGVNATATVAACVPAAVWLAWRRQAQALVLFTAGAAAVSAWWIGPLVVLGKYSPPFTEFIESASVTSAWLNPVEILRGTTSWAPFVDTERLAGFALVAEPVFVIATCVVAAFGLAGLARADMPQRGALVAMLAAGFALLASAHSLTWLYDGALAPLRNLHKFDPLVRLPLALGVGWFMETRVAARAATRTERAHSPRAVPQLVGVGLAAAIALAPAWSLRLLPEGTWEEVSPDWVAAGEWLDQHAAGTRTLVVPAASFARQEWGWTRDEPIQALTHNRFAFRDAIPLVPPEAIRGLDGQVATVDAEALRSIGVGAVVVRRDLARQVPTPSLGVPQASFGDVDIFLVDPARDMMVTSEAPLLIDASGETLPLLWRELGYFPARLVGDGDGGGDANENAAAGAPAIITDTPALAARNYGTLDGQSAHLADLAEDQTVSNRLQDYPSAGTRVGVRAEGVAKASSSAADAGAFGGPEPAKSLTAAFDGLEGTAWWPAPGDSDPWLYVEPDGKLTITATANTQVILDGGSTTRAVTLVGGQPRTVSAAGPLRIRLTEPVGIAEVAAGASRIVQVPGTADTYFFQRIFPATDELQRRFTTAADGDWELSAPASIDGTDHEAGTVWLSAGPHDIVTDAETVLLSRAPLHLPSASPLPAGEIAPADTDRTILTTRAFNPGLRASVGGVQLAPVVVDTSSQAFILPANTTGTFAMWHAGDAAYRASLAFGGALSLVVAAWCLWVPWRRDESASGAPHTPQPATPTPSLASALVPAAAVIAAGPLVGVAALVLVWGVRRWTSISMTLLASGAMTVAGAWLARAPWPAANYAGDSWLLAFAGCVAVASLAFPESLRIARAPGTSTSS